MVRRSSCGVPETAGHIVCIAYVALRAKLLRKTELYVLAESDLSQPVTKEIYPYNKFFVYGRKESVGKTLFLDIREDQCRTQ